MLNTEEKMVVLDNGARVKFSHLTPEQFVEKYPDSVGARNLCREAKNTETGYSHE